MLKSELVPCDISDESFYAVQQFFKSPTGQKFLLWVAGEAPHPVSTGNPLRSEVVALQDAGIAAGYRMAQDRIQYFITTPLIKAEDKPEEVFKPTIAPLGDPLFEQARRPD